MWSKAELRKERVRNRPSRKATTTDVGKSIARLVPRLDSVADIVILTRRLEERRKAIIQGAMAKANREAFERLASAWAGPSPVYVRAADSFVVHSLISVGHRYRIESVHRGRKYVGLYLIRDDPYLPTAQSDSPIFFPAGRAADLVLWSDEDSTPTGLAALADRAASAKSVGRLFSAVAVVKNPPAKTK